MNNEMTNDQNQSGNISIDQKHQPQTDQRKQSATNL